MAQNATASPHLSVRCAFSFRHIVGCRSTAINSAFRKSCSDLGWSVWVVAPAKGIFAPQRTLEGP